MLSSIDQLLVASETGERPPVERLPPELRPLAQKLIEGAAPREALLNLRKLVGLVPASWRWPTAGKSLHAVASVLSSGPGLTALIARRPQRLALLQQGSLGQPTTVAELRRDLDQLLHTSGAHECLGDAGVLARVAGVIAAFRNDHFVRLSACEFGLASLEQVGVELASLADVCLEVAMAFATLHRLVKGGARPEPSSRGMAQGLVALGMGKYGAQELNFCSDIDVVFFYRSDEDTVGGSSAHEFYSGVCRDVVQLLGVPTEEGIAFRVDLRLRPEGERGPICNSLASAERYYETWGGPYDRLAWLKARVVAGRRDLGETMLELLRPFVYPRSTSGVVIEQIRQLSARIRAELRAKPGLVGGWNVKLGEGGIRDIEFFVQALQLLHGGRDVSLRERGTLRALEKLFFAGLVSEQERHVLAEGYELYRRLEHRLQLHGGRQTHHLPDAGALRAHVVAHLGYEESSFAVELARYRALVAGIYATLGSPEVVSDGLAAVLRTDLADARAEALLGEAGFRQPGWAWNQIQLLRDKPWGPFADSAQQRLDQLALTLLTEVADAPDPDLALGQLVDLTLHFGPLEGMWSMLAANREARRLLCNLFGSSEFLGRLFIRQPELLDQLLLAGRAEVERDAQQMARTLDQRLAGAELEESFGVLEKFRDEEVLRIGLNDIAGDLTLEAVWQQLSGLAEQILRRLFELVYGEVVRRHGRPRLQDGTEATMVVVGLGKLGGREMSYGSDLDVIFIYSGSGETDGGRPIDNGEFFAKVAQRLIRALTSGFVHGSLYQVDTRLRPSGSQGTLVSSRAAFEQYHRSQAQIWERQVLTKGRVVAGDSGLARQLEGWIEDFLYTTPVEPERLRLEIVRLRRRMEAELADEDASQFNLKLGRGGILDVEFVAQYLQLCFGGRAPALRAPSTIEVIDAAVDCGVIDAAEAGPLVQGYRFLRRLEGRIRVVRGRSAEAVPVAAEQLELVARRMGYRRHGGENAGERLLAHYRQHTHAVRRAFQRVFGLPEHES